MNLNTNHKKTSSTPPIVAVCSLLLLLSNAVSVLTTANGLSLELFRGALATGLIISIIVQLAKMVGEYGLSRSFSIPLLCLYAIALSISSFFSFTELTNTAYTPTVWSNAISPVIKNHYREALFETQALLEQQNTVLTGLIDPILAETEQLALLQHTSAKNNSTLPVDLLQKYADIEYFTAADPYYIRLEQLLRQVEDCSEPEALLTEVATLQVDIQDAQQSAESAAQQAANNAASSSSSSSNSTHQLDALRRALNAATDPETRARLQAALAGAAGGASTSSSLLAQQLGLVEANNAKASAYRLMRADLQLVNSTLTAAAQQPAKQALAAVQTIRDQLLMTKPDADLLVTACDTITNYLAGEEGCDSLALKQLTRWCKQYSVNSEHIDHIDIFVSSLVHWETDWVSSTSAARDETACWNAQKAFMDEKLGQVEGILAATTCFDANGNITSTEKNLLMNKVSKLRKTYLADTGRISRALTCLTLPGTSSLSAYICLAFAVALDLFGLAANLIAKQALAERSQRQFRRSLFHTDSVTPQKIS